MSAPVLSLLQQKSSISGKKKKKKTIKNILSIPIGLQIQAPVVESDETLKLKELLMRLLPSARLPVNKANEPCGDFNEESSKALKEEAMKKRKQLSLGVNELNKSIKKGVISAAILASDCQPKFFIQHLNLLCEHSKLPYLLLAELREVTQNCLGFPCIAIGFKNDGSDYLEVIDEIKLISQKKRVTTQDDIKSESEEEEKEKDILNHEAAVKIPFEFLYRTSTKERKFIPEMNHEKSLPKTEDFIVLDKDESEIKEVSKKNVGISTKFVQKRKKFKKMNMNSGNDDDDESDDDLAVPKKKIKKDWVIDKVGNKRYYSYHPANLVRVPSNPNRKSKNG